MSVAAPAIEQPHGSTRLSLAAVAWSIAALGAFGAGASASGHVAVGGLVAVAVMAVAAARSDWRTGRIPNPVVAAILATTASSAAAVVLLDRRPPVEVVRSMLLGVLTSGALLFALVWVLRSNAIGGGDVKMLGALGLAIGLVAPLAAGLIVPFAVVVALLQALVLRTRRVVLGPGITLGFVLAGTAAVFANGALGGWF